MFCVSPLISTQTATHTGRIRFPTPYRTYRLRCSRFVCPNDWGHRKVLQICRYRSAALGMGHGSYQEPYRVDATSSRDERQIASLFVVQHRSPDFLSNLQHACTAPPLLSASENLRPEGERARQMLECRGCRNQSHLPVCYYHNNRHMAGAHANQLLTKGTTTFARTRSHWVPYGSWVFRQRNVHREDARGTEAIKRIQQQRPWNTSWNVERC